MVTKKSAGSKKTEALTLRLDPKMKYQIELLSRIWHQSITGVIENAVGRVSREIETKLTDNKSMSISVLADIAWAPDDADRIVRLAALAPHLLSHDEACIWSVIDAAESDCFFRYWVSEKGKLVSVRPRMKAIKLSWSLILGRAEQVKNTGVAEEITVYEVETLAGKPLDEIKETERISKWEGGLDNPDWLSKWDAADMEDLKDQIGGPLLDD